MLIRAIVGNQIKMLNTAAKQSPGKDANTFMLITAEDGEKKRGAGGGKGFAGCRSAQSACEGGVREWELRGREIK